MCHVASLGSGVAVTVHLSSAPMSLNLQPVKVTFAPVNDSGLALSKCIRSENVESSHSISPMPPGSTILTAVEPDLEGSLTVAVSVITQGVGAPAQVQPADAGTAAMASPAKATTNASASARTVRCIGSPSGIAGRHRVVASPATVRRPMQ